MSITPMMQQYLETKKQYKDCIIFYRLGDFYEMFFEDAITASKELEITLTGKNCGLEERAPMCGVPYHAVDSYLNKLVTKGYKVAIVEQVEDPATAKGIVKREVVRIVTPGTNLNTSALDETKNNYLMSIVCVENCFGIAIVDITTGDFFVTEVENNRALLDEIYKFMPSEIICNDAFLLTGIDIDDLKNRLNITLFQLESWYFDDDMCKKALTDHFKVYDLSALGIDNYDVGTNAAGALMQYLTETQKNSLSHLTQIIPYSTNKFMILDTSTRRNLELCETLREKQKRGSLLWVLDKTKTAMGARMLRSYIEQPLIDKESIIKRQKAIEELNKSLITRDELREYLSPIYDLERLISKVAYKSANPRDLIALLNSLKMLPHIKTVIQDFKSPLFKEITEELDVLDDITSLIDNSINEDPPINIKEGGIIKEGYNEEVDRLRKAKTEGKTWLAELETKEKEKTGIKGLKIKYNKVFGYYLDVTNSYKDLVPDYYVRKQTLTNSERYTTDELKQLEDVILGAEDKLFSLEYNIFSEIRDEISSQVVRIQTTAKALAKIDVFASLAYVAEHNNYVKPNINEKGIIDIKNGRHPVVEKMMPDSMFVTNDTYLDMNNNRVSIITGPNMAGKSTYMRQTALITLMAQIGSFVPATSANIGVCDKIFTRVGASDDLASGQSTFMVEMTEVANILRNATPKSLLILDEIGRGTSTFDGLSIAWAVVEHICDIKLLGAKTLFATHYHELTELEGTMKGVNNYCISVKEQGDNIVFLRKIVKGGADKSYGIQVAKLAGVPDSVINRAKELVAELSNADITAKAKEIAANMTPGNSIKGVNDNVELHQMSLFDTVKEDDIITEIEELDLGTMTPIDALNHLYKIQNKLRNRW
ncbi:MULTISPECIES: DNA mismatch repair protein MutS [Eubacterium]|jgi:DNA mismatch repair protein MutS|uniref:DNA mismatch repair protein MutS n=1 Tax=Eubacterium album TaxID=2978477 RepID=A0ABT2M1F3_9FIRM|nr:MULTISPECIES: DNA mismatch repair protein MutS [unclassified Eubacterium (in: firmicutes)]MCT7399341.1 DNA mismatch repair protein MutS [Eubacterium sp. LFL-14]CDA28227.1 dNA mismatch repair protein MutS [Eubacterium sp. CAG:156]